MDDQTNERPQGQTAGTDASAPAVRRELTSMQRMAFRLLGGVGNTLEGGTVADQRTAAVLSLALDAIAHNYEAELVALVRAWRLEREAGE